MGSPWPEAGHQAVASSVRLDPDGKWNGSLDVASGAPNGLVSCEKEAFFPGIRLSGDPRTRLVLFRLPPTLTAPQ